MIKYFMEKYKGISEIALIKILILEYGVSTNFNFSFYPKIEQYKTKFKAVHPVSRNYTVFDIETSMAIIPEEIILSHGEKKSIVKLRYNQDSPIALHVDENFIIDLIDSKSKESLGCEVNLVRKPNSITGYILDGNHHIEFDVFDYVGLVGLDRISIIPFDGCWNWAKGTPCKFCDLHPKRIDAKMTYRPSLNTLCNFDMDVTKWWNNYKDTYFAILNESLKELFTKSKIGPHLHILLMAGNLPDSQLTWDIFIDIAKIIGQYTNLSDTDSYLNIAPHVQIADLNLIKDMGVKQVQYNLELFGKKQFQETCPGKLEYNIFIGKLKEAVSVMGRGNVRSNFVFGLQPINEIMPGLVQLAEMGIVPDYSVFQPKKGTPYANRKSPSLEEIMEFSIKLSEIYKKYDYSPIYCSLSSRSSIMNELMMQ